MFCPSCGKQIKDESTFCTECGNQIYTPENNVDSSFGKTVVQVLPGMTNPPPGAGTGIPPVAPIQTGTPVPPPVPPVQPGPPVPPPMAPIQPLIPQPPVNQSNYEHKKKKSKALFIIIALIAIALIGSLLYFFVLGSDDRKVQEQLKLGEQYLDELDYEAAIAAYETAIDIDPKCEEAYSKLGEIYVTLGEYDNAVAILEEGIEQTDSRRLKKQLADVELLYSSIEDTPNTRLASSVTADPQTVAMQQSPYNVTIKQYDISQYPHIRLYVDVQDSDGNFVDNLSADAFYVNEGRTIDGELTRANLTNAAKLNENAGISISLVADVSGSMDGLLGYAQNSMLNFLDSVQFEKGDEIEVTQFSDYAQVCVSFTDNETNIRNAIGDMYPMGSTRLYDTLISELGRIQSRNNVKCLIGFTDGYDNLSIYSAEDVVRVALQYNIPVFLVGIGSSVDEYSLSYISDSTGGFYQNISDVSSLEGIYQSIYTEEKDVYLLEYDVTDPDNFDENCYATVSVYTDAGAGECEDIYSFSPDDYFALMYNKFLIAGIDCQTNGERNLLDSGLIITTAKAYNDPDCLAYQCLQSITNSGVGSNNSNESEMLSDYGVLSVEKVGNAYVMYCYCTYDITKIRKYSEINNADELEYIDYYCGSYVYDDDEFMIEESFTNYEKLTLVQDTDGLWKFKTRVYERMDGGKTYILNEIYNIYWY